MESPIDTTSAPATISMKQFNFAFMAFNALVVQHHAFQLHTL